MTFDPFGDFESRGYLRNLAKEKDPAIVRRLEHTSFTTGIDDAFEALKKKKPLTYSDVLSTHNTLFEAMYPWAGQDRTQTAPNIAVSRGSVLLPAIGLNMASQAASERGPTRAQLSGCCSAVAIRPWQCLNFFLLPQKHKAFLLNVSLIASPVGGFRVSTIFSAVRSMLPNSAAAFFRR